MTRSILRKGYPLVIFQKLIYLIHQCRLYVTNIAKEYNIYEDSVIKEEENEIIEPKDNFFTITKDEEEEKDTENAYDINSFINECLKRIFSKRQYLQLHMPILNPMY